MEPNAESSDEMSHIYGAALPSPACLVKSGWLLSVPLQPLQE